MGSLQFFHVAVLCTIYMTVLWALRRPLRNNGLVDFGWPSSFSFIALFYLLTGTGWHLRTQLFCGLYLFCGLRMAFGWLYRTMEDGEERRWNLWVADWAAGHGLLGIRSIDLNFLVFYQLQNIATISFLAVPLRLSSENPTTEWHALEIVGLIVWGLSFVLENIADWQLLRFKRSADKGHGVMETGLWRYSRHPNYFFEFMIWCSYTIFAWPSARTWSDYVQLLALPLLAYWFLVHFTGVPMNEKASLQKRGKPYHVYQQSTNMFFPGPKRRLR